jgi:hypothetical protein
LSTGERERERQTDRQTEITRQKQEEGRIEDNKDKNITNEDQKKKKNLKYIHT